MKNIILILIAFVLNGCINSTQPSSFYMLNSIHQDDVKPISNIVKNVSVDVNVSGYIDRPQIVTQTTLRNQYHISEFNRWLEPISSAMQRTVAENISYYLPKSKVKPAFMGVINPDYKVIIDVDKMDGIFNNYATLRVWWNIVDKNNKVIYFDNLTIQNKLTDTYNDFASQQSELISQLSLVIAKKIATIDN